MKLIAKSRIKTVKVDSVLDRKSKYDRSGRDLELLDTFEKAFNSMAQWRAVRFRNIRYVFKPGGQWEDMVQDEDGNQVSEKSRIEKRTGGIALQNNHLFKIVTSMAGVYTRSDTKPVVYAANDESAKKSQVMTAVLQKNYDNDKTKVLLNDALIEAIVGGMPVLSVEWAAHDGVYDCHAYKIDPSCFVFRSKSLDPRHFDCDMVGDIRDCGLYELASMLMNYGTPWSVEELKKLYASFKDDDTAGRMFDQHNEEVDFRHSPSDNLLRTYHIWTLEYKSRYQVYDPMDLDRPLYKIETKDFGAIEEINAQRTETGLAQGLPEDEIPLIEYKPIIDQYWMFRILSPDGTVLHQQETPYEHGSHPYVFMAYHFVNGTIYPYISVIIDQQRYINRLITLHDLAINSSIKGLKMVPKSMLGGMSPEQFAKTAVEFGGWIFYEPDPQFPNLKPEVITSNSTNIGTAELLSLEVSFINDLSSVSDSLQGKKPQAGTSAARYEMEMQNSATSINPLLVRFSEFENDLAMKKMQTIHQYYDQPIEISQKRSNGYLSYAKYDPQEVADIQFETGIKEAAATPIASMMGNQILEKMWDKGEIGARQMLEMGNYPGTEDIVMQLTEMEQQVKQGGQIPQVPQQTMDAVNSQANQNTVDLVRQALQSNQ